MLGLLQVGNMKKIFFSALGISAGVTLAISFVAVGIFLYQNRDIPWSSQAISAEFDSTIIDQDDNSKKITFVYILSNNSDKDWNVNEHTKISLFGKLAKQNSLSGDGSSPLWDFHRSIFLPSGQRIRFEIKSKIPFDGDVPSRESDEVEKKRHQENIAAQLNKIAGNLDGFVMYDHSNRNQITFPSGWKK